MKNWKRNLTAIVFTTCLINLQSPVWAADGALDPTFGTGGIVTTDLTDFALSDEARSVAVQSDGKIVAAGYSGDYFAVVRYNSDGSLDTSFDEDGVAAEAFNWCTSSRANSVAIQSDGKILAAGYVCLRNGDPSYFAVARYNSDGSLDSTFEDDGERFIYVGRGNGEVKSIALQSDGKIILAGRALSGVRRDGTYDFAITRLDTNGYTDSSFNGGNVKYTSFAPNLNEGAWAVAVQSDDKIVAVGVSNDAGDGDFAVVRYESNGSLDSSFDFDGQRIISGTFSGRARSVAIQSDGKILLGGFQYNDVNDYDFGLIRLNSDGSLDLTFGEDGVRNTDIGNNTDVGYSLALQADGKIVVAGTTYNGSFYDFAVLRYTADGLLDTTFSEDGIQITSFTFGNAAAYAVAIQSDGSILVAGGATNEASNTDFALVRFASFKTNAGAPWVGVQSITCPAPNPWVDEKLGFAKNIKPVLVSAENTIGKTITQSSYDALRTSGVEFDTVSKKVSTATETLPIYGCKDKLLSGKVNQPIQFIAGGYTLQSDAHGYINTSDLKWHDTNGVTLYTNTAAFMHTIKFTQTGKYVVVLTEQPDTSRGLIPTYGVRSIRFVININ